MKRQLAPEDRQAARQQLVELILDRFSEDEFEAFLHANGYSEVVEAIPSSTAPVYVEELVLALERRGKLDTDFFMALARATDAQDDVRRIAGLLGVPVEAPVLREAVDDLVQALAGTSVDDPGLLDHYSLGSRWRDVLVTTDGPEKPSLVISRLAQDPTPEAAAALRWLFRWLFDTAPSDSELLEAATRVMAGQAEPADTSDDVLVLSQDQVYEAREAIEEDILPVRFLARGLEAAQSVVAVYARNRDNRERYAFSTGWLLSPSLVVTPAHLFLISFSGGIRVEHVPEESMIIEVVFDFDDSRDGPSRGNGRRRRRRPRTTMVGSIESLDERLDLALLRLEAPVHGRTPLRVRPDPLPAGTRHISLIHHFQAGPKTVSLHGGPVLRNDGHELVYLAASGQGSAGGPVLDNQWRVVGTHRAWRLLRSGPGKEPVRAKTGTTTSALLEWIRQSTGVNTRVWREVVAAQPDLKLVDATIRHTLAEQEGRGREPRAPFIVRVLDAEASLDDIPGLRIDSRRSTIVSATGTAASLDKLIEHPGVLSIEASLPGGTAECWASIPHIGADVVHKSAGPANLGERGDSALVAVIDNGVDVLHQAFLDEDGQSRIVAFWDQRDPQAPIGEARRAHSVSNAGRRAVEDYGLTYGALYVQEDIQEFVNTQTLPVSFPMRITMKHGTRIASIAVGRRTGNAKTDFCGGVAPEAKLVVVRPDPEDASIGYAKGYIDALDFIDSIAKRLAMPVVVNISAGMNAGSHDGTSDVEVACESFLDYGRAIGRVIVKSAGNERQQFRHAMLDVPHGGESFLSWETSKKQNGNANANDLLELWFPGENSYRFQVIPPSGRASPTIDPTIDPKHASLREMLGNGNQFRLRYSAYHADNGYGSLRLEVRPGTAPEVEPGRWMLLVEAVTVVKDEPIHAWIELSSHRVAAFSNDVTADEVTVTIPGTAEHVIAVGAVEVHAKMRSFANSSRGPTRGRSGIEKPVIVAPGVNIHAGRAGTSSGIDMAAEGLSGTSYAAPHVTGAVALVFSARSKDPDKQQLNSAQIDQALKRSARHFTGRWNHTTGFGELNVIDLLKEIATIP